MADDILQTCRDLLSDVTSNQAIIDYCNKWFSAPPRGYLGIDDKSLPSDSALPWIAAWPESSGIDPQWNRTAEVMRVACVCKYSTLAVSGVITEYAGYDKISDFAALVYNRAVALLRDSAPSITPITVEMNYPYFTASFALTLGKSI